MRRITVLHGNSEDQVLSLAVSLLRILKKDAIEIFTNNKYM